MLAVAGLSCLIGSSPDRSPWSRSSGAGAFMSPGTGVVRGKGHKEGAVAQESLTLNKPLPHLHL